MHSEKHLQFEDVITGRTAANLRDLPIACPGYDSYRVHLPRPTKLSYDGVQGLARYLPALPVGEIPLTLGEGDTPLIPSKVYPGVWIKNESMNPTGNFKDRENALALSYAKQKGWNNLSIVSSGNAALSAALYGRIYGINVTCYVPEHTSSHKVNMIRLFGGNVHHAGRTYEECYRWLLTNLPEGEVNITSGISPLRAEGAKTIAYELWEELGIVPDCVVCCAGNGSLLASIYHGFRQLCDWGYTNRVPAMICVQVRGADPINQAMEQRKWMLTLDVIPDSRCEAIVAQESYCAPKAIAAVRESEGFGVSVDDDAVVDGLRYAIDKEGIFPEFSCGSVFAAFLQNRNRIMGYGPTTVLINSGSGLKEVTELKDMLLGKG